MKQKLSDFMEAGRLRAGHWASKSGDLHGAFEVNSPWGGGMIIMSAGGNDYAANEGWEHVSVSFLNRTPSWREMSWVKNQFWNPDECVVQFHPPESEHVNRHPNCLHLWKHRDGHATPPKWMVG